MNGFGKFCLKCFNLFYHYKIYGKDNLPQGKAIIVCNHFRGIDPGFIADLYSDDIFFLAKKELFKNKLFGKIITKFGAISIDRNNFDLRSLQKCIKVLNEGHKLAIFPEGTRNKTGTTELQEIKEGTAFLSVKTKTPIVPVMLLGKAKIFRKQKIYVGKPFEFSEYYDVKPTTEDFAKMNGIIREKMLEAQQNLFELCKRPKKKK